MTDLRSAYDAAVGWLVNSHIRIPGGGYHSIYKPDTHEYVNWYNNETCLVSTAGAVLALDASGHEDLALESATYICGLVIDHDQALQGAIVSGKGGRSIFANWIGSAIVALLQAYERSGQERFLAAAASAGRFVINRMQNADGSINQELSPAGSSALHGGVLQPRQIWLANCVEAWPYTRPPETNHSRLPVIDSSPGCSINRNPMDRSRCFSAPCSRGLCSQSWNGSCRRRLGAASVHIQPQPPIRLRR
jgi:hypothetical protein